MDETIAWIVLVCGMMGGLINMLERGGSVLSFGELLARRIKTKRGTMLTTCFLGVMVFIDDYLNSLAVSASMKNLTDRYKISREKLSFLVDSTAAPVCILVPVSTWAVYFAALLEENGATGEGKGHVPLHRGDPLHGLRLGRSVCGVPGCSGVYWVTSVQ